MKLMFLAVFEALLASSYRPAANSLSTYVQTFKHTYIKTKNNVSLSANIPNIGILHTISLATSNFEVLNFHSNYKCNFEV